MKKSKYFIFLVVGLLSFTLFNDNVYAKNFFKSFTDAFFGTASSSEELFEKLDEQISESMKICEFTSEDGEIVRYIYSTDPTNNTWTLIANEQDVDESYIYRSDAFFEQTMCPNYIYYGDVKVNSNKILYDGYLVLTSDEKNQRETAAPNLVSQYKLYTLQREYAPDGIEGITQFYGTAYEGIDWDDLIEVNCEGIIGQDMLDFINKIFGWIQIIAPIFVIIMGGVDFAGSILSDDKDALKKASSKFIKRLLIAVVIFFVPLLLNFVLDIFNSISGAATSTCGIGG